jgi:hypothetical protein
MLKKLLAASCAVLFLIGCGNSQSKTDPAQKNFGTTTDASNAIPYDAFLPQMATVDSLPVKIVGKVGEVCQKKGCWMTLVPEQPGQPEMRVTFKDYAFFMPKDLSGKRVVVDGFAFAETTPVDVLRHYAEDAGKTKAEIEAITQPKREVSFEAAGVLILD